MFKTYTVRAGKHYAWPPTFKMWLRNEYEYDFIFYLDDSCMYNLAENHGQINKVAGVAFGPHHANSIRIGWTGDKTGNYLYAYYYLGGTRLSEKLCEWVPWRRYHASIFNLGNNCICLRLSEFETGTQLAQIVFLMKSKGLKYRLGPYFGGIIPAPHDVRVHLEWL